MTFLYNVLLLVAAFFIIYLLGYILTFCILFFYFDDHDVKYLKDDSIYAFGSWLVIALMFLCYILGRDNEDVTNME